MAAPPISERHLHHFHRRSPIKEAVRVGTTANITIATALNNGDSLDGITLATDDRVLVKDQSTGSQNGIYIVGASPARAYDQSTDDPAFGFLVYVREGTAGGGTLWKNTNTTTPTIGTTALTFAQFTGGSGAPTTADYLVGTADAGLSAEIVVGTTPGGELGGTWASPTVDATHSGSTHDAATNTHIADTTDAHDASAISIVDAGGYFTGTDVEAALQELGPGGGGGSGTLTTVKDEGSNLSTAVVSLDFVGAGVTATGTTAVTVTIPGGSGIDRYFPLDRASVNGTYGDQFDGASLNGRWTRHVQGSGEESYQVGGAASALRVTYNSGAAARYIYQTAPNGTNETWECCLGMWSDTTGQMFVLLMVDSSGNGVAAMLYDNARGFVLANVASHTYSSALSAPTYVDAYARAGQRQYLKLRKASGAYFGSYSLNGETYSPEATGTPSAFTPARVGVGRILGTSATSNVVDWYWFDKTA